MFPQWLRAAGITYSVSMLLAAPVVAGGAPTAPPQPSAEVQALLRQAGQAEKPAERLRLSEAALARARSLSDRAGEAGALLWIGDAYWLVGVPQKALEFHQQALPLMRAVGDQRGEGATLNDMGLVYSHLGQPQKALELYHQALPLRRAVGDQRGEATTLTNMGSVFSQIGQRQKALEFYRQALPLFSAVGDTAREAVTLNNIGEDYLSLGQPQKALEFHNQALPLLRAAGDQRAEAATLTNIGSVYKEIGQPQKALEFHHQALPLLRAVGDQRGEAVVLTSIGLVYGDLGQPQKALEFYRQALPLRRAVGDQRGEATTLTNMGSVFSQIGQPERALEFYHQALPLLRAVGDRADEAVTLSNMGADYLHLGQPQKALEFCHQALPLLRAVGDKAGEARTLNNMGFVYSREINQPRKALLLYHQALLLLRAAGDRGDEALILSNVAQVEESLNHLEQAGTCLRGALTTLETMRAGLGPLSEAKVSFLGSHLGVYHRYIHLLLLQHNATAAFAWAERSKARSLLDLLAAGKVDLPPGTTTEAPPELQLRRQESQLNQQLVAEAVQPSPDPVRLDALKRQLARTEGDLQTLTDRLFALHPDRARSRLAKTVTLAELAHFLPADTALLDYVVLNDTMRRGRSGARTDIDQTVLFCVTLQNGQPRVQVYSIPWPRAALTETVDDFRQACADPRREYQFKARELYQRLVAPAARQLAGKRRLLICPDGPLWGFPFQALIPGSAAGAPTFLAQRYEIDYAYSATAAQVSLQAGKDPHRPHPTGTLLCFANPDFGVPPSPGTVPGGGELLASARPIIAEARPIIAEARGLFVRGDGRINPLPGTEQEAQALQHAFPDALIFTGSQAQKATALKEAGKYRYLHFATHGLLNDGAPWMSAVVLAQPPPGSVEDQFLTARDLCDLKLSAELVVLSACDTARGEQQAGEGMVGLSWALFVAGAPSQVVSQWSVNDRTTATLMGQFYAGLKRGQGKGAALRRAALGLLKDGQHEHPYYWAPFILLGDWR